MSWIGTGIVGAVVLGAAACASTPDGGAQELAGCYYFERDAVVERWNLPWGVRLTTDSLATRPPLLEGDNVRAARTLIGPDETSDYPFAFWQVMAPDSIRLGSGGIGGISMVLSRDGQVLAGRAYSPDDTRTGPTPSAPVRLTHARCP